MGYFTCTSITCNQFPSEWQDALTETQRQIPAVFCPLEVKALQVFSVCHRLMLAARLLAQDVNQRRGFSGGDEWKPIFIEATSLLLPMVELVGHARLAHGQSDANLWAGFHWLRKPELLPQLHINAQDETKLLDNKWQIGHLVLLRNYYLHGSKEPEKAHKTFPIEDVMSFELPGTILRLADQAVRVYWEELKQDDGTHGWLQRLADATIRPLIIQGSGIYEKALVDRDIVGWLEP